MEAGKATAAAAATATAVRVALFARGGATMQRCSSLSSADGRAGKFVVARLEAALSRGGPLKPPHLQGQWRAGETKTRRWLGATTFSWTRAALWVNGSDEVCFRQRAAAAVAVAVAVATVHMAALLCIRPMPWHRAACEDCAPIASHSRAKRCVSLDGHQLGYRGKYRGVMATGHGLSTTGMQG